jgi:hypothetical protein
VLKGNSKLTKTGEGEAGDEQSEERAHCFIWNQRDFLKRYQESIPHIIVTFYGGRAKMWKDFASNFGSKITSCCITTCCLTFLFHRGISYWNNTTVVHEPPFPWHWPLGLFLFPAILTDLCWLRQSYRLCWTLSQDTTYRMHLKTWQKRWEQSIFVEGTYFEGDGGS